jgi:hypothetical protein
MNANFQAVSTGAASEVGGDLNAPILTNPTLTGTITLTTGTAINGHLLFTPDATWDIGQSLANRPRDVFSSRNLAAGGQVKAASGNITPTVPTAASYVVFNNAGGEAFVGIEDSAGGTFASGQPYTCILYGGRPSGVTIMAADVSGTIRFISGTALRGQWSASGELLVGTIIAPILGGQVTIDFNGALKNGITINTNTVSGAEQYCIFSYGSALNGSIARQSATNSVLYNTTSDARLKDDIGPARDLAALRAVVVHDFRWRVGGTPDRGVFAQETAPIFPRAITIGSDGADLSKPWMTDYSKFVPDLIVGWQDHDRRLARLESAFIERTA